MKRKMLQRGRLENQVASERYGSVPKAHLAPQRRSGARKLPLFVELGVIRQVTLRDDTQHLSPVDHDRTVEQGGVEAKGRADDEHRRQIARSIRHARYGFRRAIEERILMEQVVVGVRRQSEFGEHGYRCGHRGSLLGKPDRSLGIIVRIGHAQARHANSGPDEAVRIHRVKGTRHRPHYRGILDHKDTRYAPAVERPAGKPPLRARFAAFVRLLGAP